MPTKASTRKKTTKRSPSSRARKATRKPPKRSTNGARRRRDVIALIKDDHATVNRLFRRYESLGEGALKSRRSVAERVIKELSIHAAVEEQVLYPNVRAAVPDGDKLVKEGISEHQEVKEALVRLDKCRPDSDEFDDLMHQIRDDVRHHVKEEEQAGGMLPKLRKHASRDELLQMAKLTRTAKRMAPTRPHPKAPSTPPGNVVVGAAAAVVDKVRDKVSRRK
jgi:hemerythrin superfamily protein